MKRISPEFLKAAEIRRLQLEQQFKRKVDFPTATKYIANEIRPENRMTIQRRKRTVSIDFFPNF